MSITAIVPAAGFGIRMKDSLPKQFLILGDKPVLFHTLSRLADCSKVDEIIVAVSEQHYQYAKIQSEEEYPVSKPVHFVVGADDRQESVRNALGALGLDCELVVIHDGVRPFLSNQVLVNTINAAQKNGAATAAIKPPDTVKMVEPGHKAQNLPRDQVHLIQTPQAFSADLIRDAHKRAHADNFSGTDDTVLVERLGQPVTMVEGDELNIKITTPASMVVAKAILDHIGD